MGWWKTAYAGQKIVFIGDFKRNTTDLTLFQWLIFNRPKKGAVYAISSIHEMRTGGIGFCLYGYSQNFIFRADMFKPLQSRPTDISIFTEILNKPHVPISEDA